MTTISSPESTISLMQQLQLELGKASGKLKAVPDEKNLNQIISRLSNIIEKIQKEKAKDEASEKVCCFSGKAWNRIKYVIGGTAALSVFAGYVAQISDYYDQESDEPPPSTVYSGTIAIALAAGAGVAQYFYNRTQKKRKAVFDAQNRQLDEAISLQKFFLALSLYLGQDLKTSRDLRKCATELQDVPVDILPTKARARWMRAAAKTLPEESTLRQKLERAETLALQACQEQTTATASSEYDSIDLEEEAPKRRGKKGKKRSQFLHSQDADQGANISPRPSATEEENTSLDATLPQLARELSHKMGVNLFYAKGCTFDNEGNITFKE